MGFRSERNPSTWLTATEVGSFAAGGPMTADVCVIGAGLADRCSSRLSHCAQAGSRPSPHDALSA